MARCEVDRDPETGSVVAFVCRRGRRDELPACACGARAEYECDGLLEALTFGREPKTCDAPICSTCRTAVKPWKDLCRSCSAVTVGLIGS